MNEKIIDTIDVNTLDVSDMKLRMNMNTAWAEYFLKTLGIPYTQEIHGYCWKEFNEHYGKYLDKFLEVCHNSKTGCPAMILYNLYKEDIIDDETITNFLDDDKLNRRQVELVKYYLYTDEPSEFEKYEEDALEFEESNNYLSLRASGLIGGE